MLEEPLDLVMALLFIDDRQRLGNSCSSRDVDVDTFNSEHEWLNDFLHKMSYLPFRYHWSMQLCLGVTNSIEWRNSMTFQRKLHFLRVQSVVVRLLNEPSLTLFRLPSNRNGEFFVCFIYSHLPPLRSAGDLCRRAWIGLRPLSDD
jgi:hypothetical protein